jgi:CHASE2 domain-containing sensor protein
MPDETKLNNNDHHSGCINAAYAGLFTYSLFYLIGKLFERLSVAFSEWRLLESNVQFMEIVVSGSIIATLLQFSRIYHYMHELDRGSEASGHILYSIKGGHRVLDRSLRWLVGICVIFTIEDLGKESLHEYVASKQAAYLSLVPFAKMLLLTFVLLFVWDWNLSHWKKGKNAETPGMNSERWWDFWHHLFGAMFSLFLLLMLKNSAPKHSDPLPFIYLSGGFSALFIASWLSYYVRRAPIRIDWTKPWQEIFSPLIAIRDAILGAGFSDLRLFINQRSWMVATIAVILGLVTSALFQERFARMSYDYLNILIQLDGHSRNSVAVIELPALESVGRDANSDARATDVSLLKKLSKDGVKMVVLDYYYDPEKHSSYDPNLTNVIGQIPKVLLASKLSRATPTPPYRQVLLPQYDILQAARERRGVAELLPDKNPDNDHFGTVRMHWSFSASNPFAPLPEVAAAESGIKLTTPLEDNRKTRWMRYYRDDDGDGADGIKGLQIFDYATAMRMSAGAFKDMVVFVGSAATHDANGDNFWAPSLVWGSRPVGGVRILATTYLNLVNGDWLRRWPVLYEWAGGILMSVIVSFGVFFLPAWRPLVTRLGVIILSSLPLFCLLIWCYQENEWFNWFAILIQAPVAGCVAAMCRTPPSTAIQKLES